MSLNISRRTALLLLAPLCLTAGGAGDTLTSSEREQALRYLAETRIGVVDSVKGLSDEQWKFKPAPDRWSIAEVVEHLALIEDVVVSIEGKIGQAAVPAPDFDSKKVDAMILARVPDRSEKVQAPPQATPTARWTPAAALQHYLTSREQTVAILRSSSDLRGHVTVHPIFGPMDGYEWILAVAAHSERHAKQIQEVKADPHFPAAKPTY